MSILTSNLLRFARWLTLIVLVGVTLLLVTLRWQPTWLVAFYNNIQDSIAIELNQPEITFFPVTIAAEGINLSMPELEVAITAVDASASFTDFWNTKPFWAIYADTVKVETAATGNTSGSGTTIPPEALAFTTVNVSQLQVNDQLRGRINLTQADPGIIQVDLEVQQSGETGIQTLGATGTLTQTAMDAFSSDLNLTLSQPESLAANVHLVGVIAFADTTTLELSNSRASIDAQGVGTSIDELTGEIGISPDAVSLVDLKAVLSHAEGDPHPINLSGRLGLADSQKYQLTANIQTPSRQTTDINLEGILDSSNTSAELTLNSAGLPTFFGPLPLTDKQLYPLKITGELELEGSEITVSDLNLASPANRFSSSLTYQPAPLVISGDLAAEVLSIPLLTTDTAKVVKPDEQQASNSDEEPLFSEQPLDWSWLDSGSVEFTAAADVLNLQDAAFQDFQFSVSSDPGVIRLNTLQGNMGEGGFTGSSQIASTEQGAELQMQFNLQQVALETFGLLPQEELAGGQLLTDIQLNTQGASPAELAANLNGFTLLLVDSATLSNDVVEIVGSDVFTETLNKLNPFYKEDPSTEVACALARFEIENGVLKSDRELILETDKMEIFGEGKVELAQDNVDITFSPSAKQGIGVNVGSLVKFLKLGGSVRKPAPEVDALGVLQSGAAIGAAVATGGVSVLAEGLAKRVINAGSVCDKYRLPKAEPAS